MAVLELTVQMSFLSQLVVNRYHYVSSGTPAAVTPSFGLMKATGYADVAGSPLLFPADTLARKHQVLAHGSTIFIAAYARNLYSATDFYERPYISAVYGSAAGDASAPFNAIGFFSSRARTDIRRGMKRIGGISEAQYESGGQLTASALVDATAFAEKLAATITYDDEGNTLTFVPCVLGLEEYTTPAGNRAYRPYATESAQLAHVAQGIDWAPYTRIRSQVSRQVGRGA